MILKPFLLTFTFSLAIFSLFAQDSLYHFKLEAQAGVTSKNHVPFWLRSNQFGSVPLDGASGSFIAGGTKRYESDYQKGGKFFDWGASFEGRVNGGNRGQFILLEAYAKIRLAMFELKAGRTKDIMGLNGDTTLSSGNFAVSGNTLGIPKVEISIPKYYTLPLFDGLFAIKGNIAHGWVGRFPVAETEYREGINETFEAGGPKTYFHQASFYGQIGKPSWKAKVQLGINHQAHWGNEKQVWGSKYDLSPLQTFWYVFAGQAYGGRGIPRSKIGNQLGSVDIGFSYDFSGIHLLVYRQNIYDVGAIAKLANIRDGLNGVALSNKRYQADPETGFQWKKILVEFLYTKNQAGERWSKPTPSGDEDYYNNFYYSEGWSYNSIGIGTPFITPNHLARDGQAEHPKRYFINNRVVAIHGGGEVSYKSWSFLGKLSYSKNYGTFATSETGTSLGGNFSDPSSIFQPVNQFSAYVEATTELKQGFSLSGGISLDRGKLLDNRTGGVLKITKSFQY